MSMMTSLFDKQCVVLPCIQIHLHGRIRTAQGDINGNTSADTMQNLNSVNVRKNAISAEWIEAEVIEYTKLLVRNQQFAEDIQSQIGQKVDVSEIDIEIQNYRKKLTKLERSKSNLERSEEHTSELQSR